MLFNANPGADPRRGEGPGDEVGLTMEINPRDVDAAQGKTHGNKYTENKTETITKRRHQKQKKTKQQCNRMKTQNTEK